MRNIAKISVIIIFVSGAVFFSLAFPNEMGNSVKDSINRCLTIIIPSMFIFICITSYISLSGLHSLIGKPFEFIAVKIFRIPKEGFTFFMLSLISGYPAGIKLVGECLEKGYITNEQSRKMSCFCYSGGPAFISGTAAAYLYPDSNAALLIFISVISANILTAFILTRTLPKPDIRKRQNISIKSNVLIASVRSASSAMVQMCIMIAAFGGICCMLKLSGAVEIISEYTGCIIDCGPEIINRIIMSFLEISNIVELPKMDTEIFPAVTFLLSFGGVCVIMQIAALAHENFDLKLFIISRLFTAFCAAIISRLLIIFLNLPQSADITCGETAELFSQSKNTPASSILLFIMMLMTLELFGKSNKNA